MYRPGTFYVRADVFYQTLINSAGGEMVWLGGHRAFDRFDNYHLHIAMIASPSNENWYNRFYNLDEDFTRWGLRYGFISGSMGSGNSTNGSVNAMNYFNRPNLQFWNHLFSGSGMIEELFLGQEYFMDNYSRTFPWNAFWINSTSFTIGLLNAVGLEHRLSVEQIGRAIGIDNAFALQNFGVRGNSGEC